MIDLRTMRVQLSLYKWVMWSKGSSVMCSCCARHALRQVIENIHRRRLVDLSLTYLQGLSVEADGQRQGDRSQRHHEEPARVALGPQSGERNATRLCELARGRMSVCVSVMCTFVCTDCALRAPPTDLRLGRYDSPILVDRRISPWRRAWAARYLTLCAAPGGGLSGKLCK